MIRVLIIEDEIIIARFIEQELTTKFQCTTRIALSPEEARSSMSEILPHLILCDIHLNAAESGIDLITSLQSEYAFEVIYITSYQTRAIIEKASCTNPANYIIKPVDEAQLLAGMQLVISKISRSSKNGLKTMQPANILNNTELNILKLIRHKKTTREIADELCLSPYTVKNHRHNICRKLDLEEGNNALLKWLLQNPES